MSFTEKPQCFVTFVALYYGREVSSTGTLDIGRPGWCFIVVKVIGSSFALPKCAL
jgi:hypothetical protein